MSADAQRIFGTRRINERTGTAPAVIHEADGEGGGERECVFCGAPATHSFEPNDALYCERCAGRVSAYESGLVIAGLNALRTAYEILGYVGIDLDAAVQAISDDQDEHKLMDLSPVGAPRWAFGCGMLEDDTRFVPIGEAS